MKELPQIAARSTRTRICPADGEEGVERDYEDLIHDELAARGAQTNLSVFAFTATPKSKTLELFGRQRAEDGKFEAHSLYSMRQAIDETDRRREKQQAYNLEHGIEPQALVKSITDIMDVGEEASPKDNLKLVRKESKQVLSAKDIASQIKTLEAKMHAYASDLEFEKAASVRDEIHELQQQLIN